MANYEFYCPTCNTLFNFLSRSVAGDRVPPCPRDKAHALQKKVSRFAALKGGLSKGGDAEGPDKGGAGGMDDLPIDEGRMEKAMEALAGEAEHMSEDDPRQAARLMRKLSDMTGLQYGGKFEEALSRMEAGEDPEAIEAEMGDALEGEEPFVLDGKKGGPTGSVARRPAPSRDETLYEM